MSTSEYEGIDNMFNNINNKILLYIYIEWCITGVHDCHYWSPATTQSAATRITMSGYAIGYQMLWNGKE